METRAFKASKEDFFVDNTGASNDGVSRVASNDLDRNMRMLVNILSSHTRSNMHVSREKVDNRLQKAPSNRKVENEGMDQRVGRC